MKYKHYQKVSKIVFVDWTLFNFVLKCRVSFGNPVKINYVYRYKKYQILSKIIGNKSNRVRFDLWVSYTS